MIGELTAVQGTDDRRRSEHLSTRPSRPPTQVPGYEAERFLGRGAFGEVWVATDLNTRRRVAIKFYNQRGGPDWSLLAREVEKLAFLFNDRHVVQLIQVGWEADPPYYIMEYLENGSLEERLHHGPLEAAEAVALFREMAQGLQHAHAKGIMHCDLKPGNILLDREGKPRLADFGQARLSHEHAPALGTLFYMAPEQADLKAAPDARWDVYALGAILYRMLTGRPPYQDPSGSDEIMRAGKLEERLERYRQLLRRAPPPTEHRKVPGVDAALADVIARCLAVKQDKRFPNVQTVLSALDARALRRARRPLLILGAIGPALLLLVIALFAWTAFTHVVERSERNLTEETQAFNAFAAERMAELAAGEIDRRWRILELEAADPKVRRLLEQAWRKRRVQPDGEALIDWRQQPEQEPLQEWLNGRHEKYASADLADTWQLADRDGWMLARTPPSKENLALVGKSFAFRDWFHGRNAERPPGMTGWKPIRDVHLSSVIISKADGSSRVVFTVPVWADDAHEEKVIGVVGMAVILDNFFKQQEASETQHFVLVESKKDAEGGRGLILDHPKLAARRSERQTEKLPAFRWSEDLLEAVQGDSKQWNDYQDPVLEEGPSNRWLAAAKEVRVKGRPPEAANTGWIVVVQKQAGAALGPVQELKASLKWRGLLALGLILSVVLFLWGFVLLVMNDSSRSRLSQFLRRKAGLPSAASSRSGTGAGTGSTRSEARSGAGVRARATTGRQDATPASALRIQS